MRSRRSSIEKLPHDIINGQPLHYRRTDDGQFVLYSVGWDEKDDGGVPVPYPPRGLADGQKANISFNMMNRATGFGVIRHNEPR